MQSGPQARARQGGTNFAWVLGVQMTEQLSPVGQVQTGLHPLPRPGRPPVPTYVISGGACQERPPGLQAQICCGAHLAQCLFPRGWRQSPELLWIELWLPSPAPSPAPTPSILARHH